MNKQIDIVSERLSELKSEVEKLDRITVVKISGLLGEDFIAQINKMKDIVSNVAKEEVENNSNGTFTQLIEMLKQTEFTPELIQKLRNWERQRKIEEGRRMERLADRYYDTGRKYAPHLNSSSPRKRPDSTNYDKNGRLK